MTPEEQRIAIAMACGMVVVPCTCCANPWKNLSTGKHIPDYLNDLNAMHDAEKVLTSDDLKRYQSILVSKIIGWHAFENDRIAIHATAAQRARAFLETLGLWDNGSA